MNESKMFYIQKDDMTIKANILTNFEIYGDNYCIYTIPIENTKNNNVYCAKIVGNKLVPIEKEEDSRLTDKIINELMKKVEN